MKKYLILILSLFPLLLYSQIGESIKGDLNSGTSSVNSAAVASQISDSLENITLGVDIATSADSVLVMDDGKLKVMSKAEFLADIYSALNQMAGLDMVAPTIDSIEIGRYNDSILVAFFHESDIHVDSIPPISAFNLTEGGTTVGLDTILFSATGDSMLVVMDSLAEYGLTYLFDYTKAYKHVQDSSGNDLANFSDMAVINYVSEPVAPLYPALLDDENTIAWYIADAANLTVSNDSVSQWNDLSGNDYHITATGTARPIFDGDSITFDGVNDGLSRASMTYSQPITIYFVFKHITNISSGDFVSVNTSTAARLQESYNGSDYIELHAGLGLNVVCSLNEFHIVRAVINGASSEVQVDDATPETGDAGARTMTELYVGTGAAPSNISVKELIIRGATDDAQDEQDVMDYLNDKYSIY